VGVVTVTLVGMVITVDVGVETTTATGAGEGDLVMTPDTVVGVVPTTTVEGEETTSETTTVSVGDFSVFGDVVVDPLLSLTIPPGGTLLGAVKNEIA